MIGYDACGPDFLLALDVRQPLAVNSADLVALGHLQALGLVEERVELRGLIV